MHMPNEEKQREIPERFRAMAERARTLSGRAREIAEIILSTPSYDGTFLYAGGDWRILHILWHAEIATLTDIFQPGSDESSALEALIGAENAAMAKGLWDRFPMYPYQKGSYRHSYRSHRYSGLYIGPAIYGLYAFISGVADGFSIDAYLDERQKGERARAFVSESGYVPYIIALLLDRQDERAHALLARIREIVADEAGRATLTREIISGLIKCEWDEPIALVRDLLKAARLQEGLRQAIVEEMDGGSRKAFLELMKTIAEENMTRFSSVTRAFFCWIGIYYESPVYKRVKAAFETACRCLADDDFCRQTLDEENPLNVIIALWAVAFRGIEFAEQELNRLLSEAPRHKKLAALAFTASLGFSGLQYEIARPCLDNPAFTGDMELMAWVVSCLSRKATYRRIPSEERHPYVRFAEASVIRLTLGDLHAYYLSLKRLVDAFGNKRKEHVFEDSVLPGRTIAYGPAGLLALMMSLLKRKAQRHEEYDRWNNRQSPAEAAMNEEKNKWGIRYDIRDSSKYYTPLTDELDELTAGEGEKQLSLRDDICGYADRMDADTRRELLQEIVYTGLTPVQRRVLIAQLADRNGWNRTVAWGYAIATPFSEEELLEIEDYLRFKDGKIRQPIFLKLLLDLGQEPEKLGASICRLLADPNEMKRRGGEELLAILARRKDEPAYAGLWQRLKEVSEPAAEEDRLPGKSSIDGRKERSGGPAAAERTERRDTEGYSETAEVRIADRYNRRNGFGLYDPARPLLSYPFPDVPDTIDIAGLLGMGDDPREPIRRATELYVRINEVFVANRLMQYTVESPYGGTKEAVLGETGQIVPVRYSRTERGQTALDDLPLAETWRRIRDEVGVTGPFLSFVSQAYMLDSQRYRGNPEEDWLRRLPGGSEVADFGRAVYWQGPNHKLDYAYKASYLVGIMLNEVPAPEIYWPWRDFTLWAIRHRRALPADCRLRYYEYVKVLIEHLDRIVWQGGGYQKQQLPDGAEGEEMFADYFKLAYEWYYGPDAPDFGEQRQWLERNFSAFELAYAHRFGLLTGEDMTRFLMEAGGRSHVFGGYRGFTTPRDRDVLKAISPALYDLLQPIVQRVADIEKERGDLATEVSGIAGHILGLPGTRHFVDILERVGDDPFDRSIWESGLHGDGSTRKSMLSHLLYRTHPAEGEDAETFRSLMEGRDIGVQRLIDGAMFAPQWLSTISAYLGWEGLESACWYFQAHVNETFSAEKATMVARYSAIEPKDFKDGAFDIAWFNEAYRRLGEERFEMVYAAAKYISGGANHRRAQLFADALRGKLSIEEAEQRIIDKRNLSYVLSYGLIPLHKTDPTGDAVHRYEILQKFIKESKQFGNARRASEARAVEISVSNLARNAGYADSTRFTWAMEGEKLRTVAEYLEPRAIGDGVEVWMEIDDMGNAEMKVRKNGKEQKSLPAKFKKDPYVEDVRNAVKSVKEQHSRARFALERSMEREVAFAASEIRSLAANPILGPMVRRLVFADMAALHDKEAAEGAFDFPDGLLAGGFAGKAVIAHPVHMHETGVWAELQHRLYDEQIVQPFKQVFRELYLPTQSELAQATESTRYAGHQVQVRKGIAMLKTRGWTTNYWSGLQKVYHQENLIATVYAAADWFSPNDVEAPSVEGISFYRRREGDSIRIGDVPPVIFSEVMRDIDLMVSVAYVGGVDVEASESTVAMRRAIASEVARLFKLQNVRFEGSRAFITGTRGEYTVHLGSGTVQKIARGALAIINVPSQQRGHLFLPFIDEDPRTAEIATKILFFAEDGKIKDPAILEMLS